MNINKIAQKCYIYWDYENCPIPEQSSLRNVVSVLKQRVWKSLQIEVPVEVKLYIRTDKVSPTLQRAFDVNGIKHFQIPSLKPESVDKRILIDVSLALYDWKGINCNAVALISGDKDFGHLLGRIQKVPEIAKLLLIQLPRAQNQYISINPNLTTNVDEVINDFKTTEFIDCKYGQNCKYPINCSYYHSHNLSPKTQQNDNNISPKTQQNDNNISPKTQKNDNLSSKIDKDEKESDIEMEEEEKKDDNKTMNIRKQIKCKYGIKCKHLQSGNCHYSHSPQINNSNQLTVSPSPCVLSPSPPQPPAISMQPQYPQYIQYQQQQIQLQQMQQYQNYQLQQMAITAQYQQMEMKQNNDNNQNKTLQIRSKIMCKYGAKCRHFNTGNCHYRHPQQIVTNNMKQISSTQIKPKKVSTVIRKCKFSDQYRSKYGIIKLSDDKTVCYKPYKSVDIYSFITLNDENITHGVHCYRIKITGKNRLAYFGIHCDVKNASNKPDTKSCGYNLSGWYKSDNDMNCHPDTTLTHDWTKQNYLLWDMMVTLTDNENVLSFGIVNTNKTISIPINTGFNVNWTPYFILYAGGDFINDFKNISMEVFKIQPQAFGKREL